MRAFVALHPSAEVRERVGQVLRSLQEGRARVKWVEVENLHFTLRFLGDVTRLDEVESALRRAAQGVAPWEATLRGVGAFPSLARPQVVWMGLTAGVGDMVRLYRRLSTELESAGVPPEPRAFQPHLTLGRCKEFTPDLHRRLEHVVEAEGGSWRIEQVSLMESVLGRTGPVYTHVLDVPLA